VARQAHTATVLSDGKVLVAAGRSGAGADSTAELFDPATNLWATTGSLATPRYHHTDTLLPNGQVLATGGLTGRGSGFDFVTTPLAELYDPSLGRWTPTSPLRDPRDSHTATLLPSGKVLAAGGITNFPNGGLASAELYDPATRTWSSAASMAGVRANHTATLLPNGKVLVAGGEDDFRGLSLASAELYDPGTNTWSATGPLGVARKNHTATLLPDGKVLVAGGQKVAVEPGGSQSSNPVASAELYNPTTGMWSPTGALGTARFDHTATSVGDRILVTGGTGPNDSFNLATFPAATEVYSPASGTWTVSEPLATGRYAHTASLLPGGRVLVAGGCGAACPLSSSEVSQQVAGGGGSGGGGGGSGGGGSGGGGGTGGGGSGGGAGGGYATPPPARDPGRGPDAGDGGVSSGSARQRRRAAALRRCLRRVRRARPRSGRRAGARVRRRQASLRRRARRRCLARHGRTPGRVRAVRAREMSKTRIVLSFRAAGSHGQRPPAARSYLVKQSTRRMRGRRGFSRARTRCDGACRFTVTSVGARIALTITDLRPHTRYYFAVAARDNVSGRPGPRSRTVRVRTK